MFKKYQLAINISLITGSLLIFALVFYWLSQKIDKQAETIAATRSELLLTSRSSELLAHFKKDAPEAQDYTLLIQRFIPSYEELVGQFPAWLNGLAANYKLPLDFRFQNEPILSQENVPGYIPINFQTSGSFDSLAAFVKELEMVSPKFFISLSSVEMRRDGAQYHLSCQGKVYFK